RAPDGIVLIETAIALLKDMGGSSIKYFPMGGLTCRDEYKAVAFVIPKQSDTLADREAARDEENAIMALVDNQIGHFGRPAH
ncbi:KDGP aldolase, partial [Salmonella enterica subsp. enterica serovar Anatum]|nr:KDGP aldolase [Salmonella enterica subsp. enterica serovar Anatum]